MVIVDTFVDGEPASTIEGKVTGGDNNQKKSLSTTIRILTASGAVLVGLLGGYFGGYHHAKYHYSPARVVSEDITGQTFKYTKKDLVIISNNGDRYGFIQTDKGYYQPVEQYMKSRRQAAESPLIISEDAMKTRIKEVK